MQKFFKQYVLYIAWIQSLVAVFGSLYFSEIVHFPPCILCWYQRIFMYPLAIIIPIGIVKKDKKIYQYVLPLAIVGSIFGFYHNLLYYGIVPESLAPCVAGVSCTTKFIEFFGFITIPFLSLSAFLVIIACMLLYRKFNLKKGKK